MTRKDPAHRAYIQSLPCAVCDAPPPSECAHVRVPYWEGEMIPYAERGATGLKPYDKWSTPLCGPHHRQQHADGEITFWSGVRINPVALAAVLAAATGNTLAGKNILLRYRNGASDI